MLYKHKISRILLHRATPAEKSLWALLEDGRLGAYFSRQKVIGPWIADFWCPDWNLVVEVDGPYHETRRDKDRERDRWMHRNRQIRTLRISNDLVLGHPGNALRLIYEAGRSQCRKLGRTFILRESDLTRP